MRSSGRLTDVANATAVDPGRAARSRSNTAPSCQGRACDRGLYSAITKPADAAAVSRRTTVSQGFRLSDSEIAQKSCPRGAPIRAAAANIAEIPGTTSISSARQTGSPPSIASNTALAIANTPASPDDTTATRRPCGGQRQREACAVQFLPVVGGVAYLAGSLGHPRQIRRIADQVGSGGKRGGGLRRLLRNGARPEADNGEMSGHRARCRPGTSTIAKYGAVWPSISANGTMRSPLMVPRST